MSLFQQLISLFGQLCEPLAGWFRGSISDGHHGNAFAGLSREDRRGLDAAVRPFVGLEPLEPRLLLSVSPHGLDDEHPQPSMPTGEPLETSPAVVIEHDPRDTRTSESDSRSPITESTTFANFVSNERVQATANLNVRSGPSLSEPVITTVPSGSEGNVVAGPSFASGFTWYAVDWDMSYLGWSVDDYLVPAELPTPSLSSPVNGVTDVSTTPTFNWSSVNGADGYWLTVADNPAHLPSDPTEDSAPNAVVSGSTSHTSYTVGNTFDRQGFWNELEEDTTHYWQVQAFEVSGGDVVRNSDYSDRWSFTTEQIGSAPNAPSDLAATPTSDLVSLAWTDNSDNEDSFSIDRRVSGSGSWNTISTTSAGIAAYLDHDVDAGTTYDYRVFAENQFGQSGYSNTITVTVPQPDLDAPNLFAPSQGANDVSTTPTFDWSSVTDADGYWLTVSDDPADLPTDPEEDSALNATISGSTSHTSYTVGDTFDRQGFWNELEEDTTYYWQVQAFEADNGNVLQESDYSAQWSFTTAQIAADPVITGVPGEPLPAADEPITFALEGQHFEPGFSVTLHDVTNDQTHPPITSPDQLEFGWSQRVFVEFDFGGADATWAATIHNPDGRSSEPFEFQVEQMDIGIVHFEDDTLEEAVRQAMGREFDTQPIRSYEMLELTSLFVKEPWEYWPNAEPVSSLVGLEHAENLERLEVIDHEVSDLSPLSELTQLETLEVQHNNITTLSPLANLNELETLRLHNNDITNITPLAGLSQLWELSLSNNEISDITPLAGLFQLEELLLGGNEIADISPLEQFSGFHALGLGFNEISEISSLSNLDNVAHLDLSTNNIDDIAPLAGTEIQRLHLGHAAGPSWRFPVETPSQPTPPSERGNEISDITPLLDINGLSWVDISYNHVDLSSGAPAWSVIGELQDQGTFVRGIATQFPPGISGPSINTVGPEPIVGSSEPQPLTIHGQNFHNDATVTLHGLGQEFPDRAVSERSDTHITINPILTVTPATWTVEVTNPDLRADEHEFEVLAPPPELTGPGRAEAPGDRTETLTPTFEWEAVAGADGYGLFIAEVDSDGDRVDPAELVFNSAQDYDGLITGTSFELPEDVLAKDTFYRWNMSTYANEHYGTPNPERLYFHSKEPIASETITNWWVVNGDKREPDWQKHELEFNRREELVVSFNVLLNNVDLNPNPFDYLIGGENLVEVWTRGIEEIWGNRDNPGYNLETAEGDTFPIIFEVDFFDTPPTGVDDFITVDVHAGNGGINALTFYPEVEVPDSFIEYFGETSRREYQYRVAAHEAGHWFGLYDEYWGSWIRDDEGNRIPDELAFDDNGGPYVDYPLYESPDDSLNEHFIGEWEEGRSKETHELIECPHYVLPCGRHDWEYVPEAEWKDHLTDDEGIVAVDDEGIMGASLGSPRERNYERLHGWLLGAVPDMPDLELGRAPNFSEIEHVPDYNHSDHHEHPHEGEPVSSTEPLVDIGDDAAIHEGTTFVRLGSFIDPDEDVTWMGAADWGDGTAPEPITIDSENQTFELARQITSSGEFEVRVEIQDSEGAVGGDMLELTVLNVPPVIEPIVDQTIGVGEEMAIAGSFTDPGDDEWIGRVDYGDGSGEEELSVVRDDQSFTLSHSYETAGDYTATVTIDDQDGGVATETFEVIAEAIEAPAPTLDEILVNDGHTQRSMVTSLRLNFDRAIEYEPDMFELTRRHDDFIVDLDYTLESDDRSLLLDFASLADGVYDLTTDSTAIHDGNGQTLGENIDFTFHRLFGDMQGRGYIDGLALRQFANHFGTEDEDDDDDEDGYRWFLDYDGSGDVGAQDYFEVRTRWGMQFDY